MSDNTELVAEARGNLSGYSESELVWLARRLADALEAAEARLVEPINRQWAELFDERDEARRIAEHYRNYLFPTSGRPLPWESPPEGGN